MKKIVMDSSIMTADSMASAYRVQYFTYYDHRTRRRSSIYIPENALIEFNAKYNSNTACFAGFSNEIGSYYKATNNPYNKIDNTKKPMPNRVYYLLNPNSNGRPKPTLTEKYAWLRLCKEHKLLPEYVAPTTVRKGYVVFDISNIPPSLLYVYLNMMRVIVEYPAFVKSMVYLVNKLKMNFFAAFIYASRLFITNNGHHIINANRGYYGYNQKANKFLDAEDIEIHWMRNLRIYIENPTKYDKRNIYKVCQSRWNCYNTIEQVSIFRANACVGDLFKEKIADVINAETVDEAKKHYDELKKVETPEVVLQAPPTKKAKKYEAKIVKKAEKSEVKKK